MVSDWRSRLGIGIVLFFVLLSAVGPVVFPGDPSKPDYSVPPNQPPSGAHWLGTDQGGRDMFLQLVHGGAPSLAVGFSVGIIATVLAALVGVLAGASGRLTDGVLTLLTNVFLLIPGLPLVIVIASYVETSSNAPIILILALTGWAFGARILRSQALSIRGRDFVVAAVVRGESRWRIVTSEILPNMVGLLATIFISASAGGVAAMAGLQFLGLGDISEVNWFTSLYWAQNYGAVLTGAWWTFLPAGLAIALLVTGLALINYGIDVIGNPRLRVPRTRHRERKQLEAPQHGARTFVSEPSAALLDVRDLVVDYRTPEGLFRAVDGVSFDVVPGEVFGIAGESGSGKSTVIQAILRLAQTSTVVSGALRFDGVDLLALDQSSLRSLRWERISLVSQSSMNALSPVKTVGDHFVDTIQSKRSLSRRDCLNRAGELLAMVGIEQSRVRSYPHQLSGGMRQRVALALALALDPQLIIMDEPTTALDVVVQREILQQIADLRERLGFAMIFITHDLALLMEISDRIAVMRNGDFVEVLDAVGMRDHAEHPYTRSLLAASPEIRMSEVSR
ncbi:dipeptide/oligopeptide/nickel ABC transporter permease/ATP-binding protein [Microbacterium sp.]|uniref:dipeptide/oligopeptide/nickel ABC transporter permease/ATP-binding protein n=1 Tax=Microbacterium sp. TaxID=51671 RepID=UPI003F6FFD9F